MSRILYGVSPIGLGHATRTIAVVEKLEAAGIDVQLFSGRDATGFLKNCGYCAEAVVSDPAPRVVGGEMKMAAYWYIRSWLALRMTMPRTSRLFDRFIPDLVVSDEEFSGMGVAFRRRCRRVFISDELELGFARGWFARAIERRVDAWYKDLQASVDMLLVPELGADLGNLRHTEPIVRPVTKSRGDARAEHNLPIDAPLVLLSLSGSRMGSFLLGRVLEAARDPRLRGVAFAVTGNQGSSVNQAGVYDLGVVIDNQNLVAASDLVVSTAGKSTADEAARSGVSFIGVPIRHHAEQERNALSRGHTHIEAPRLAELIVERVGRKVEPTKSDGAEQASKLIQSLLP